MKTKSFEGQAGIVFYNLLYPLHFVFLYVEFLNNCHMNFSVMGKIILWFGTGITAQFKIKAELGCGDEPVKPSFNGKEI